ncbi:tetratricopeptide repeat protein [Streptomyces hoynatensis]|uniref:Tetratricopeptide repeat protein n=1 Tax=Streptomyces hoynatensis TaxID=1141874 RepID=A0A3A9YXZ0_9ACTN|nr:tetratricopeptide repeat protein [Streptomyces hoynatensis]RKN40514.1 tetratricopeptide repeat protein [Streptomyces hoynatensis]
MRPNHVFRELRGGLSPGEFAAAVRRAAREIGERVCCDARYIGRVESGDIRCPNYAYERVFLHMYPGRSLTDLGFEPRQSVRGRGRRAAFPAARRTPHTEDPEEGDVLRRAFMTGGPAAVASLAALGALPATAAAARAAARPGEREAAAVHETVREIRVLDDRHGADALYRPAAEALRSAYQLLDAGARSPAAGASLHAGAGELALSVGWLAHDSGRFGDARSHYAEALATARVSGDAALEAHAFCNASFLARSAGRPREAVRAAQAGQAAARRLGLPHLTSLLALREAGGWAGLGDRGGCEQALALAHRHYERGAHAAHAAPEWMSFFNDAEFASLHAQCLVSLGEPARAAEVLGEAVAAASRDPHFARNGALYAAELSAALADCGRPEEAARHGRRALDLLGQVRSTRIRLLLADTAARLRPARRDAGVADFLARTAA